MMLMTGLYPIENESIRSFLIRLAIANSEDVSNSLFRDYQDGKNVRMNSCEESLHSLACSLVDTCSMDSFSPVPEQAQCGNSRLGHRAITKREPHVCPDCMTMQNHTEAHWQLYPITHCNKHHKRLISTCICGENLVWDEDLLHYGCCHCDASWQQISTMSTTEKVPAYIEHFHQLPMEKRSDFLEDLLTACMRALRPYDSVHHGIKQLRHVELDWATLCTQAFALLTDKDAIEQWCRSISSARQKYSVIGSGAVFHPLQTMQAKLHQTWLVHAFKPTLASTENSNDLLLYHHMTSCNIRNKAIVGFERDEANQQLIHHIDQNAFAQILGCDLELARQLFKIPSISSLTKVGKGRYSFIDIRDFVEQTKQQNIAKSCETIKLTQLSELLNNYMMSTDDVLVEIYKHQLPIYVDKTANTLIEAIKINEEMLAHHLESTYLENEPVISLIGAAHILNLPRNLVKQLGALGLLKEVPCKTFAHDYTGKSIATFLKNYECIIRWASQHHVCEAKVVKTLKASGFKPVMAPFVFAKTPVLESALNEQFGNHWKVQEQLELFA